MARVDAAFLRGEVGADGLAIQEAKDESEVEQSKAKEALGRNRAWLGREFLTWLLYRSNSTTALLEYDGEPVHLLMVGASILQGPAGDATELRAKGHMSAYAEAVRPAFNRGLLLHQARLRLLHGEKVFEVTVDAEFFGFRSVSIPKLMTEETDEVLEERLFLIDRLTELFDQLWLSFVKLRCSNKWHSAEVPKIKKWLSDLDGLSERS